MGVIYRRGGMCVGVGEYVGMRLTRTHDEEGDYKAYQWYNPAEPNSENPRYASVILITSM